MGRNARLVFIAKTARTACYGFLGVFFPVYLTDLGLGAAELGVAVTLTLIASAGMTFAIRRPAERFGPRAALLAQAVLIVVSAVIFLLVRTPWPVVAAAMIGNLAVGTGETGPFLTLEQVVVTRDTPRDRLNTVLSFYNLSGYAAAGLGAAAVGRAADSPRLLFGLFLVSGLVQLAAYGLMRAERPRGPAAAATAHFPSRSLVRRLAALFALDSLAGGFVLQSLVAYWFHARFGAGLAELGWIFFGAQLLSGLSLLLAARAAPRLGLVNTMVFSHLVSNLFLIGIGLAPTLGMAVTFLLARHLLSQMDVPTRQTFLMLAVEDHEREGAASLTNMSRTLAQSVSPTLAGWVMQGVSLGAPLLLGGGLKIVYDLMLYATIRNVQTAERSERARSC
ncbi:MAG TPA: MFS transporter [Methylomirabilota bacterium]|jgi:MFS family permease|nr:MFS transporter [Methylomirabilota bacterium]